MLDLSYNLNSSKTKALSICSYGFIPHFPSIVSLKLTRGKATLCPNVHLQLEVQVAVVILNVLLLHQRQNLCFLLWEKVMRHTEVNYYLSLTNCFNCTCV